MTFTYDLSSSDAAILRLSQVRALIPDNDISAYDLEDEEITFFLSENGNDVWAAAADACEQLARKFAKKATFSDGALRVENSQRASVFAERARELRARQAGSMTTTELIRSDGYADATTAGEYDTVFYTWKK